MVDDAFQPDAINGYGTPSMDADEELMDLARKAGIKVSVESSQTRLGYRDRTADDDKVDWADYGRAAAVGTAGVLNTLPTLAEYATQGAVGGETRRSLDRFSQDQMERMSPEARRAMNAEVLPGEGEQSIFDNFSSSLGLQATAALPSIIASIIPAGLAARAAQGLSKAAQVSVAAGTARATNAAMVSGETTGQIYSTIERMNDDELAQLSPVYAGYRSMMSPREAREKYMQEVAGAAPFIAAAIGALTPGVETQIARRLGGEAAKGVMRGARTGAITELAQETIESGGGEFFSQDALIDAGLSQRDWQSIISKGLTGGMVGAAVGGAGGGIAGIGGKPAPAAPPAPPVPPAATGISAAQAAALAATSPATAPTTPPPPAPPGAPPAAAGISAAQAAALNSSAPATAPVAPPVTSQVSPPGPVPANPPIPAGAAAGAQVLAPETAPNLDGSEPTVPEPRATIRAQLDDLRNGVRSVVMIPKGTATPKKPKGMKYTQVGGVGTFYHSSEVTSDEIRAAVKEDRLNDLLNMGPTSKAQAVEDISAGAEPAAVVVRKPDGTPVVEAASSSATAPQDAAAMQEKAARGDTVELSTPEAQLAERVMSASEASAENDRTIAEAFKDKPISKRVAELHAQGMVAGEIAKATGLEVDTVRAIRRTLGLEPHGDMASMSVITIPKDAAPVTPQVTPAPRAPGAVLPDLTPVEQKPRVVREVVERIKEKAAAADKEDENSRTRQKNVVAENEDDFAANEKPFKRRMDNIVKGKLPGDKQGAEAALKAFTLRKAAKKNDKYKFTAQIRMFQKLELEGRRAAEAVKAKEPPAAPKKIGRPKKDAVAATAPAAATSSEPVAATSSEPVAAPVAGPTAETPKQELARLMREQEKDAQTEKTGLDLYARGSGGGNGAEVQTDIFDEIRTGASNDDVDTVTGDESGADRQELSDALATEQDAIGVDDAADRAAVSEGRAGDTETATDAEQAPTVTQEDVKSKIDARRGEELPTGVFPTKAAKVVQTSKARAKLVDAPKPAGKVSLARKSKDGYETGKALIADVYHGTNAAFEKFTQAFKNSKFVSGFDAFWFAKDPHVANSYTRRLLTQNQRDAGELDWEGGNVRPSRIKLDNPLVVDMRGKPYDPIVYNGILKKAVMGGHDGVVFENTRDGGGVVSTVFAVSDVSNISQTHLERPEGQVFPSARRAKTSMPGTIEVEGRTTGTVYTDTPVQSLKLGSLFDRMPHPGSIITNVIGRMFESRLRTLVGNLQVHLVDMNSPVLWSEEHNGFLDGYYDPVNDHIVLSSDLVSNEKDGRAILIHEAVHAAYAHKLESDAKARQVLGFLLAELKKNHYATKGENAELPYGLSDIHELLSEAFSNPKFQQTLAELSIPPALRNKLIAHLGPSARSIRSMWDMFVALLRKALGVNPDEYTVLDAVLRVAQYLDNKVATEGRLLSASDLMDLQAKVRTPDRDGVSGLASDRIAAGSDKFARGLIKFSALNQLAQRFEITVIGPAMRQIEGAVDSVGTRIKRLKVAGDEIAVRGVDLERKYPEKYAQLVDLMQQARMHEISMEGTNDFGKDDSSNWQAKKLFPQLKAQFDVLPADLKQYYRDSAGYYRAAHERVVKSSVDAVLEDLVLKNKLTDAERAGLTRRVMDQEMTDTDKKLLGETVFDALENASAFHRVKGDYFPLMRFGDHVVVTNDQIKDTKGGRIVGPANDTVEFSGATQAAARRSAKAFAETSPMRQVGRAKKVYYDKTTGKQVTADEASGLNDVEIRFQVKLQTRGVYFFDSGVKAHEFVRTNPEGHDTIDPPEKRMGSGYRAHNFTGTQISALERHIDQRSDIGAGQRQLLKSIIAQSSIMMASGNRVSTRRLKADKVVGASKDHNRSLLQYNEAMARHISTAETMPLIRTSLRQMQDTLENYAGKDRGWLRDAQQEVIARVDQGVYEPNEAPLWMKDALTVSSLVRLFSPAYSILQAVQPWMTSLPMLGGRFGMARTTGAMNEAYGLIGLGSIFKSGLTNTVTAIKDFNAAALLNTDDVVGDIRKKIAGDKDLTLMFEHLIEHGAIDVDAGIEVSPSAMEGRGAGGRVLAGFDRVARQMPQVMEAVNRSVTGIAAYKLAREAGYPHDKATRYALDTVKNTQGDYAAANQPRFFNNPWLRPAMQFRKYAQFMTWLMVDQFRRAFRDQTLSVEEKAVAKRILRNFIAVQIAAAGALSIPGLELIKIGFLLASFLGFGGGWDDAEEYLKKVADDTFGKGLGQMITSGVITRLGGYGLDVSQRMSMSDMWLFGEPRKTDAEGLLAYAGRLAFGSPGTYLASILEGTQDIGNGKIEAGLGKILPVKFAADASKAIGRYNKGEANEVQVAANIIGFQTAAQAEENRRKGSLARASAAKEKEYKALREKFYDAKKPADRVKAISRNREWNKTAPLRLKLPVRYNEEKKVS